MTLETYLEEENLHRIRRLEKKIDALVILCEEILKDVRPKPVFYRPTERVTVVPSG